MLWRSSRLRTTLSKPVPQLLFLHQASPTQLETDLTRNYATPTGTPETSTDVGAKTWAIVATTNTPGPCSTWFCQRHLATPSPPTPCLFTQPRGSQPFLFRWQVKFVEFWVVVLFPFLFRGIPVPLLLSCPCFSGVCLYLQCPFLSILLSSHFCHQLDLCWGKRICVWVIVSLCCDLFSASFHGTLCFHMRSTSPGRWSSNSIPILPTSHHSGLSTIPRVSMAYLNCPTWEVWCCDWEHREIGENVVVVNDNGLLGKVCFLLMGHLTFVVDANAENFFAISNLVGLVSQRTKFFISSVSSFHVCWSSVQCVQIVEEVQQKWRKPIRTAKFGNRLGNVWECFGGQFSDLLASSVVTRKVTSALQEGQSTR